MYPALRPGCIVFAIKSPFFRAKDGDIVLFRHAEHGLMVKRVKEVRDDALFVTGDGHGSVDSRNFGWVPSRQVLGRVVGSTSTFSKLP